MKEIKFRAWDNLKKKIVEVAVINFTEGIVACWKKVGSVRSTYYGEMEGLELMQFTGLKDKNGEEIYEGDIVRVAHDAYHSPICIISIRNLIAGDYSLDESEVSESEVIGNIYENPELLKES